MYKVQSVMECDTPLLGTQFPLFLRHYDHVRRLEPTQPVMQR
jgi:hypothetical protein